MKVSQEKKKEIKSRLIKAAVEVITDKGYSQATMREISKKAGFGTATIYNYFPTKEKILYAYFEEKHTVLNDTLDKVPDFDKFTLKEKLQLQLESLLDIYLEEREFVKEAIKLIFDSPLRTFSEFTEIKKIFTNRVKSFLIEAASNKEISELSFEKFIANLYWDYCMIIILYWQRDDSTDFTNTSRIIDLSLDLIVEILKANIITKTADILAFLFRSHLYNNIESIHELFSIPAQLYKKIKETVTEETKKTRKKHE